MSRRRSQSTPLARSGGPVTPSAIASAAERYAHALQPSHPDGVAGEQALVLVDLGGHVVEEGLDRLEKALRRLQCQTADAEVAGHHALAADRLEDAQRGLALAPAVEEDGERADVHGVGAQPDQVRLDARDLVQQHAQHLGALGDLQSEQLLHRQAVRQVVGHRAEIVDAVGQRDDLLVELGLAGLLDAGVQVADVGGQRRRRSRHPAPAPRAARRAWTDAAAPC